MQRPRFSGRPLPAAALGVQGSLLVLILGSCGPDTTWREAFDATETGWLMNVWGPSGDELFAVGGEPERGVVVRYHDGEWEPMSLPADLALVNWAYGFGPDDVTFVANHGRIVHWDGGAFEMRGTPTEEHLWGVWGPAPDDMWAVGGSGLPDSEAVILHWDGATWTKVTLPPVDRPDVFRGLFKVWGTGADDVYAVGQRGVVLHWDGAQWAQVLVGATDDIVSLWGTGPDHIVMVGGRSNGVVSFFDGEEWETRVLGPVPGLNGVWMREPGVAHVAGLRGRLITVRLPSFEYVDESIPDERTFHSIFGVDGRLVAVGGTIGVPGPPFEGMAWERELAADE